MESAKRFLVDDALAWGQVTMDEVADELKVQLDKLAEKLERWPHGPPEDPEE